MIVTLLTDYGRDDEFVGVCHGVIRRIDPDARIVDITHGIRRYAVRQGALVLRNTLPYMPVGVHVAVVDPQVGTERRARRARDADGRLLVGPDNGVLSLAWERCGGVATPWTSLARRTGSSPCPPPSTGATSSRRSPRSSPPERSWPTRASRSIPPTLATRRPARSRAARTAP